jgi:hypothetical protein
MQTPQDEATPPSTPEPPNHWRIIGKENGDSKLKPAVLIKQKMFEPESHFYQKTLNAQVSNMVAHFMHLGNDRIVARYCHLHPGTDAAKLKELLAYRPSFFMWSGADLFNVTTQQGTRKMVLIETNRFVDCTLTQSNQLSIWPKVHALAC